MEGGAFSAVLPLPALVDGVYDVTLTASDGVRTAITEARSFVYRTPVPLSITLESPVSGQTYFSPVAVSGYVTADRTASPIIRASLQRVDGPNSEVVDLPLNIEGWSFAATIDALGTYALTVEAVDGEVQATESVRFEYAEARGVQMPLDELVNEVLPDQDGFNNAGTLIGETRLSFAQGVVDQALRFGAENYVEIANHNEVNFGEGDFSIFIWVKTSRNGIVQSLLEKRPVEVDEVPGYTLYLSANGTPSLQMVSEVPGGTIDWTNFESPLNGVQPSSAADGFWHHVGVTVERNAVEGLKLYLDGRVVGTFNPTGHTASLNNDAPLSLGRHVTWPDSYLAGSMDDLVIVKRALSPEDIQGLIARASIDVPQEGFLQLTNPVADTSYSGMVGISGSYNLDPGLTPVALEIIDTTGALTPLAVEIDDGSSSGDFNIEADCRVFSPGTNTIQARLTDHLEQTLLSPLVSFEFHLPAPDVQLEVTSNDSNGVYIYGRADFSGCPLGTAQSPQIRVSINGEPIAVDIVSGQLPGDFIFGLSSEWLQQGDNVIRVEVVDPRDPDVIGSAAITVPYASVFSVSIVNPAVNATLAGHVQVYGYFANARGPLNLYTELDGKTFIENVPVNGNQTFTFTIPAELLQAAGQHGLYLRAFDQGSDREAEAKMEFSYKSGSELLPGGDLLVLNDMDALSLEQNRPWFLNWANFVIDFDSGRKNSVLFVASEKTCSLVDEINGYCARAKTVLSELYQENGYEFSVIERALLAEIPAHIKLLILFLPDTEFNEKEILALKNFSASGGRIVYVGESYSCPECYSEDAQAQFFQQMGVEIQQLRGITYETIYKPNGELHQLTAGIDAVGVIDVGVFSVGANVVPLVISEFNQVIAAVAKINTNPYEDLQIGIETPRDGTSYDRDQLPLLTGFIEQSDLNSGRPTITATIRSGATRVPEIVDVTECWFEGCRLPNEILWDENTIEVRAVTPAGFGATDSVTFSVLQQRNVQFQLLQPSSELTYTLATPPEIVGSVIDGDTGQQLTFDVVQMYLIDSQGNRESDLPAIDITDCINSRSGCAISTDGLENINYREIVWSAGGVSDSYIFSFNFQALFEPDLTLRTPGGESHLLEVPLSGSLVWDLGAGSANLNVQIRSATGAIVGDTITRFVGNGEFDLSIPRSAFPSDGVYQLVVWAESESITGYRTPTRTSSSFTLEYLEDLIVTLDRPTVAQTPLVMSSTNFNYRAEGRWTSDPRYPAARMLIYTRGGPNNFSSTGNQTPNMNADGTFVAFLVMNTFDPPSGNYEVYIEIEDTLGRRSRSRVVPIVYTRVAE